ncbi:hypothetical protein BT63DRAFT_221344 [Microthyrium microscopicum]|uniref:Dopa 4,5-dioxygenase n=1 Tax=Microthyrium microscopicum TaxID=703497 RepID=A0A6A6UDU0_9PEZI|nr:hypothetical protein BT63DRAFT_221344 [Microthyrium microscopicum]
MPRTYPSPLKGYSEQLALPTTTHRDGKGWAMDKLDATKDTKRTGTAYKSFPEPITTYYTTGGFDAHILFSLSSLEERNYAKELHTRVRYEFPELRIYTLFEEPAGPFPMGSFEVSLRTPEELGVFVAWLVVHRGPLSVLVHPNTDGEEEEGLNSAVEDHTTRAVWMGDKAELNLDFFTKQREK